MKITCFENLDCWKEARQLTRQVYEAVRQNSGWQKDIRLCGQIQSAAGSVMANIAEGFVRRSNKEFVQSYSLPCRHLPKSKAISTLQWIKAICRKTHLNQFMNKPTRQRESFLDSSNVSAPNKLNEPD